MEADLSQDYKTAPAEESSLTGKGPVNANSVHVHAMLCSMSRKDDEGDNERSHARHEGRVRLQRIRTRVIKGRIKLQHEVCGVCHWTLLSLNLRVCWP